MKRDAAADFGGLAIEVRFQDLEHGRGIVYPVNFYAFAGNGEKDAACAAGNFEDGAGGLFS